MIVLTEGYFELFLGRLHERMMHESFVGPEDAGIGLTGSLC